MSTNNELLHQILDELRQVKSDVTELKELKKDIAELKHDVAELKHDVVELKHGVAKLKDDVSGLNIFKENTISKLKIIENFVKRDADIIELELNQNVLDHIKNAFQGYEVKKYDNDLKSIRHHITGDKLTEFDGLYMLTFKDKKLATTNRILIIIEAKRYTTKEKIDAKLKQKKILEEMIGIAKSGDFTKTTKKFKSTALTHKLDSISNVYLYVGGPYWDDGAFDKLMELVKKDSNIGYIRIASQRYEIKDNFSYLNKGGKKQI